MLFYPISSVVWSVHLDSYPSVGLFISWNWDSVCIGNIWYWTVLSRSAATLLPSVSSRFQFWVYWWFVGSLTQLVPSLPAWRPWWSLRVTPNLRAISACLLPSTDRGGIARMGQSGSYRPAAVSTFSVGRLRLLASGRASALRFLCLARASIMTKLYNPPL